MNYLLYLEGFMFIITKFVPFCYVHFQVIVKPFKCWGYIYKNSNQAYIPKKNDPQPPDFGRPIFSPSCGKMTGEGLHRTLTLSFGK